MFGLIFCKAKYHRASASKLASVISVSLLLAVGMSNIKLLAQNNRPAAEESAKHHRTTASIPGRHALATPAAAPQVVPVVPGFSSTAGDIDTLAGQPGVKGSSTLPASASSVLFRGFNGFALDSAGNLYIANGSEVDVLNAQSDTVDVVASTLDQTTNANIGGISVDSSNDLFLATGGANQIQEVSAETGKLTTVAGSSQNSFGYSGDNGLATNALLHGPNDVKVDADGNLFILDIGNDVIRVVYGGSKVPPVLLQALTQQSVSSPPPSGYIYTVAGTAGTSCPSGACGDGGPATSATLTFTVANIWLDSQQNLYMADVALNRIRMIYSGGDTAACLIEIENPTLFGLSSGATSCAGATSSPQPGYIYTIAGNGSFCTTAQCGDGGVATSALLGPDNVAVDGAGNVFISDFDDAVRRVDAQTGIITTIAGTLGTSGFSGDGGAAASALLGSSPGSITFDTSGNLYIADGSNYVIRGVTGAGVIPVASQTVSFNGLPASVTYGAAPITLSATASSGLPVTFKLDSGPATLSGSTLTITGAGTVTVEADQAGGSGNSPASTTASLTVNPKQLIVTAPTLSLTAGEAIPTLTPTYSGYVGSDNGTGAPVLTVSDANGNVYAPGAVPPVGTYTVTITQGTFTAGTNYTLKFVNGSLSVTGGTAQTVTFGALPNVAYGAAPIALFASASSGLPIQFTVTGPAGLSGSTLTITGAGTISVTATQAGNGTYAAASVSHSFQVSRGLLTVTANNQSRGYGAPNPALTYSITGFANGDTSAVVQGAPNVSTPANNTSAPGSYPITVDVSPLSATNYTFTPVNASLTVSVATQTITFTPVPSLTYGLAIPISATSTSGLPITYTSTGPILATNNSQWTGTGVGAATITATQAGNADYAAATATISFPVIPAVLTITANNLTRGFGQQNPTFTYSISGFLNGDGDTVNVLTGAPAFTTPANTTSPTGTYPILPNQGTLAAPNYVFTFVNGTLTVTGNPSYTIAANPASLTIQRGQTSQTSIIVTPINNYQGSIALSCGQLPANVTCTFSPAALTLDGSGNPVQGTLTVNTNGSAPVVGLLTNEQPTVLRAGIFLLPGGIAGLLIVFRRRSLHKSGWLGICILSTLLLLGASGLTACGGGSSQSGAAPTGTSTLVVNAAGTGAAGSGNPDESNTLNLTITITP